MYCDAILIQRAEPFDDPNSIFEQGKCRLVSRKDNTDQSLTDLSGWIGQHVKARDAILDGEIVCLDEGGRSVFNQLFYRQGDAYFYAFDLL